MLHVATFSKIKGLIAYRTGLLLILISCSLIDSSALAQQDAFRAYGDRIVGGTWHLSTAPNSEPAHTYYWTLQRRFLRFHSRAPEGVNNAIAILGIDPENNVQTWWTFDEKGGINTTRIKSARVDKQAEKLTITSSNGDIEGGFKSTFATEDRLELEPDQNAKQVGNPTLEKQVWVRSQDVDPLDWLESPAPKTVPPELTYLKGMTGTRWIKGHNTEGKSIVGSSVGRWILDGKFFLYTSSTVSEDQEVWDHLFVVGIDPETGMVQGREFSSEGGVGVFQLESDGLSISGDFHLPEDKVFRYQGKFVFDGDKMIYRSKGGVDGEEPKPYEWIFTPVE